MCKEKEIAIDIAGFTQNLEIEEAREFTKLYLKALKSANKIFNEELVYDELSTIDWRFLLKDDVREEDLK